MKHVGRSVSVVLVVVTLTAQSAIAWAQPAQPSGVSTYQFDIGAGPLEAALIRFHTITAQSVVVPPGATVSGLATPGASGRLTANAALTRLLTGTGLTFRSMGGDRYALEVSIAPESVVVTGKAPYGAETVSATKTSAPLRNVPQAVTVITRGMIADQRMQSMADVVRYVPGVGMGQGEGNRDTPIFRGNSTTADFYVDGIRDDVQYFRDLYNVDRIEALKGPNAMLFGRGGAGGIINRTTRQADWSTAREASLTAGSFGNRRLTADVAQHVSGRFAARATGVYENSETYRRGVTIERYGMNPTLAFALAPATVLKIGYEHFHDQRTADRGIPSLGNKPLSSDVATFFGDPETSISRATVNSISSSIDHRFANGLSIRNRTRFADYDKFYQNVYPTAAVNAEAVVPLGAYNNSSRRHNVFSQTDFNLVTRTGRLRHSVLVGAEFGRQATGNFRQTGYFTALGSNVTSLMVPISAPTVSPAVAYRQTPTDADNTATGIVAAGYIQDHIEFTKYLQSVVGVRYDRFSVNATNRRTDARFGSVDNLLSPRVGLIFNPVQDLSIYSSYSETFLPRAGEQFSSLSLSNQTLEPEKFRNYEVGVKWDAASDLAFSAAVYRLDRTNVVVPDPNDLTRSLLVSGQRTNGLEIGAAGRPVPGWTLMAGYAYQHARITRTLSAAAREGAALAQVPAHAISLWNRYDLTRHLGFGLGVIHNTDMFTSTDNTVTLPAFTRTDAAMFLSLTKRVRAQLNVENLFDERYYAFANGNNNITPGAPRSVRLSLTTQF